MASGGRLIRPMAPEWISVRVAARLAGAFCASLLVAGRARASARRWWPRDPVIRAGAHESAPSGY